METEKYDTLNALITNRFILFDGHVFNIHRVHISAEIPQKTNGSEPIFKC